MCLCACHVTGGSSYHIFLPSNCLNSFSVMAIYYGHDGVDSKSDVHAKVDTQHSNAEDPMVVNVSNKQIRWTLHGLAQILLFQVENRTSNDVATAVRSDPTLQFRPIFVAERSTSVCRGRHFARCRLCYGNLKCCWMNKANEGEKTSCRLVIAYSFLHFVISCFVRTWSTNCLRIHVHLHIWKNICLKKTNRKFFRQVTF